MELGKMISENKGAIVFALLVMIIGSAVYFVSGQAGKEMNLTNDESKIFDGIRYKIAFSSDGTMMVFANSKNNAFGAQKAMQGEPIPEEDTVVFGSSAAARLEDKKVGEPLINYYGLNTTIGGILVKKDSMIDEMIFLSPNQFEAVKGESGRLFTKINGEGVPKFFYKLETNDTELPKFDLAQGSMNGYAAHDLDGKTYYPMIIGAKEAKMMKDEKLFENTGDPIRGLFGRNFVVTGILEETNTSLDRMHFTPLGIWDIN